MYACVCAQVAAGSVMDAHAAALGSLRENVAALERTVAAQPDAVEGVRAEVRVVAKDLEQAQRSVSGGQGCSLVVAIGL